MVGLRIFFRPPPSLAGNEVTIRTLKKNIKRWLYSHSGGTAILTRLRLQSRFGDKQTWNLSGLSPQWDCGSKRVNTTPWEANTQYTWYYLSYAWSHLLPLNTLFVSFFFFLVVRGRFTWRSPENPWNGCSWWGVSHCCTWYHLKRFNYTLDCEHRPPPY